MHEKAKLSPDSSIEPIARLQDQFTDAEKELIDTIVKELDTDDAKELEACKAKLAQAELEIITLNVQLKKTLHQLQIEEETSRTMLVHKQMMDLRNKFEASTTTNSKAGSHSKVEIVVDQIDQMSSVANDAGLRRRFSCSRQSEVKTSLFSYSPSGNLPEEADDYSDSCFRMEENPCKIL
jgi:sucrose-6-phosphate hydrolase SacC (GH32 family)